VLEYNFYSKQRNDKAQQLILRDDCINFSLSTFEIIDPSVKLVFLSFIQVKNLSYL